jgi:tRNA-dihydrouridine synthase 3
MPALPWPHDILLAPLTRGGNLPFRRLCVDFGAQVTCSEMAYAHHLLKGKGREMALLRSHESETCFGVQLAVSKPDLAAEASQLAVAHGARFVDLNCGCPIEDTVKRGMGARLLQRTRTLEQVVGAMVQAVDVPVTVKIRLGFKAGRENADEVTRMCEEQGAAAVVVHGRTREQRYSRSSDYDAIGELVKARSIPIGGNGDVLTWYELEARRERSGAAAMMIARGALIKPWIFQEIGERRELCLDPAARIAIYHRLTTYFREHFGEDELGHRRTMYFLPWHFGFFSRYRPLPRETWEAASLEHPLLQTRDASSPDRDEADPMILLLADTNTELHKRMAQELWDATDAADAVERLAALARARLTDDAPRRGGRLDTGGWG